MLSKDHQLGTNILNEFRPLNPKTQILAGHHQAVTPYWTKTYISKIETGEFKHCNYVTCLSDPCISDKYFDCFQCSHMIHVLMLFLFFFITEKVDWETVSCWGTFCTLNLWSNNVKGKHRRIKQIKISIRIHFAVSRYFKLLESCFNESHPKSIRIHVIFLQFPTKIWIL